MFMSGDAVVSYLPSIAVTLNMETGMEAAVQNVIAFFGATTGNILWMLAGYLMGTFIVSRLRKDGSALQKRVLPFHDEVTLGAEIVRRVLEDLTRGEKIQAPMLQTCAIILLGLSILCGLTIHGVLTLIGGLGTPL